MISIIAYVVLGVLFGTVGTTLMFLKEERYGKRSNRK